MGDPYGFIPDPTQVGIAFITMGGTRAWQGLDAGSSLGKVPHKPPLQARSQTIHRTAGSGAGSGACGPT